MAKHPATVGTGTRRDEIAGVVVRAFVLGCARRMARFCVVVLFGDTEGSTSDVEGLCPAAVGEDAEVADAMQSAR